jgi:hypothetical protein
MPVVVCRLLGKEACMLRTLTGGISLLAALTCVSVASGEELKSGLQVGEKAGAFQVRNITGQSCAIDYAKDTRGSLCYR